MSVKLNVPLALQKETMECWYSSACMVAYFRVAGPRLGLPDKWAPNKGIRPNDFIKLAQAEGLKSIQTPIGTSTSQQLETFLRNN